MNSPLKQEVVTRSLVVVLQLEVILNSEAALRAFASASARGVADPDMATVAPADAW